MTQPLRFNLPTLITLTAPTCAGKNHLLEVMIGALDCERIVSTTDRAPRKGEINGLHYNFISTEESKRLEAAGDLAELVTYNGVRYGVTHAEMNTKMQSGKPPLVILEPKGIEIYRKYCASKGWQIFTVYVETQESIRLERLTDRTTNDVIEAVTTASGSTAYEAELHALEGVRKVIKTNNKRMVAILQEERNWSHTNRWDCIASGTNTAEAVEYLLRGAKYRNSRSEMYA